MRLMIIATISACKRRRIVVKYNHDKKREIKKFQSSQSQFGSNPGDQAQAMAGVPNGSSGLENQYQQNFTMSNQQYLHDMHQQQEQTQLKIESADKILTKELASQKIKMLKEFQQLVQQFHQAKTNEAAQVSEQWDSYLRQVAAQEYYQQQLLNQTNYSQPSVD